MIRLTWRQFRAEAFVTMAAVGLVAVVLAVTGPNLVHLYEQAPRQLPTTDQSLQVAVDALSLITPALLGIFFGAPLVARELETGTFRLIWTQSVSRLRWLVIKFAVVGAAASLIAGGLSLMAAWWANPINVYNANRFSPANFGVFGIVPFGYALFAFALGATTGLLFRRTLPAMATTLAGYLGARMVVTYWVRPHFASPLHRSMSLLHGGGFGFHRSTSGALSIIAFPPSIRNAWPYSASIVNNAGRAPTALFLRHACPTLLQGPGKAAAGGRHTSVAPKGGMGACVAHIAASFHEVVTFQPASRYWPFQIEETALFVVVAVVLAALSVWWVRRRLV